jgi:hypothetical protein
MMMMKRGIDDRSASHLQGPAPFEAERNSAFQIKLVYVTVMLVVVIWIGVLVSLGREIIHRVFS